jgi:hypothetical protein
MRTLASVLGIALLLGTTTSAARADDGLPAPARAPRPEADARPVPSVAEVLLTLAEARTILDRFHEGSYQKPKERAESVQELRAAVEKATQLIARVRDPGEARKLREQLNVIVIRASFEKQTSKPDPVWDDSDDGAGLSFPLLGVDESLDLLDTEGLTPEEVGKLRFAVRHVNGDWHWDPAATPDPRMLDEREALALRERLRSSLAESQNDLESMAGDPALNAYLRELAAYHNARVDHFRGASIPFDRVTEGTLVDHHETTTLSLDVGHKLGEELLAVPETTPGITGALERAR